MVQQLSSSKERQVDLKSSVAGSLIYQHKAVDTSLTIFTSQNNKNAP